MRPVSSLLALMSLITISQPAFAKLEVHEWGTFTSLVGSDGVTQNGMYHEDEQLPSFVHPFGETATMRKDPPANNQPRADRTRSFVCRRNSSMRR